MRNSIPKRSTFGTAPMSASVVNTSITKKSPVNSPSRYSKFQSHYQAATRPVAEREAVSNGYFKAGANGALTSFMDEIKTQNHPSIYQRHDEMGAGTPS